MNTFFLRNTSQQPELVNALVKLLSKHVPVPVQVICAHEQTNLLSHLQTPIINLDPFSRNQGHYVLDICRVFEVGQQQTPISYTERPGSPPLSSQFKQIPAGSYHLLDDDICTGGTVQFIQNYCQNHRPDIQLLSPISLLDLWRKRYAPTTSVYDICDSHDFIPTHTQSGLVVRENGQNKRYYYIDQHVNLHTRAKLHDVELFRAAWQKTLENFSILENY